MDGHKTFREEIHMHSQSWNCVFSGIILSETHSWKEICNCGCILQIGPLLATDMAKAKKRTNVAIVGKNYGQKPRNVAVEQKVQWHYLTLTKNCNTFYSATSGTASSHTF